MTADDRETTPSVPAAPARIAPVQARSAARLETLLDAAARVVDEVGYERLTTAMVAERAGASIGTVYRYYPDRIALLQALSARLFSRLVAALLVRLETYSESSWQEALDDAIDLFADMYRTEAGFRAIRFGDSLDLGRAANDRAANDRARNGRTRNGRTGQGAREQEASSSARLARILADELAGRFPSVEHAALVFPLEVVVGMIDALLHRAFSASVDGDRRFVDEARVVAREYLTRHISVPA